jgi:alcohol dehydrogenase class IV
MAKVINVSIPRTTIGLGVIAGIGDIAKSLSASKILILTDPGIAKAGVVDAVKAPLEKAGLSFEVFDGCKEEPPIPVLKEIAKKVKEGNYDLLIGVGGGSVMDTTKVVSVIALSGMSLNDYIGVRVHEKIKGKIIPKILVPTTAGTGSDWSNNVAIYDHEANKTYITRAWENAPNMVFIDPELTAKMPKRITADTGLDALSHAIEGYTSANANVYSDMVTGTAIKLISENLRQAYAKGQLNMEARYNMSIAAALAMNGMAAAGGGLSHFTSEFLGPKSHASHGTTLSTTLSAVMEYNMMANPAKFAKLAELMGEDISGLSTIDAAAKSVEAVRKLIRDLKLPSKISDIGIKKADIPEIAKACYAATFRVIAASNPRDATEEDIVQILMGCL